jgi:hypothetical protein
VRLFKKNSALIVRPASTEFIDQVVQLRKSLETLVHSVTATPDCSASYFHSKERQVSTKICVFTYSPTRVCVCKPIYEHVGYVREVCKHVGYNKRPPFYFGS